MRSALQTWDDFDILYDALHKWLKDTETKVKDYELKSTLDDKKVQLEKFKVAKPPPPLLYALVSYGMF